MSATTLKFHNTLTREKETFSPIDPSNVRVYACGPTVYDYAHIGNARPVVAFDILFRLLRLVYGAEHVTYVRNITDIDDKINARAKESGITIRELTDGTAEIYRADMAALEALPPTEEPRATEHVDGMIAMIEALIEKGHAYEAEGHVLFSVPSMPNYGGLSRRNRDELVAGARIEVAPYKRDPADFVLWKPSDAETPGWESPWGFGRPGWHIECSAMSARYLGAEFDIHAGGLDLIFPHHENEIAQSCCAHGTEKMARTWLHNGFVTVEGEKMSKSLGNFYTVHDLLEDWQGEVIRFHLLSTHYRAPLDFSKEGLKEAKAALDRFYLVLRDTDAHLPETEPDAELVAALADDLNTPLAIARLHAIATDANKAANPAKKAELQALLKASGALIGLFGSDPEAWFKWSPAGSAGGLSDSEIDDMVSARVAARQNKDFAEADRIRDALTEAGIVLEDGVGGTAWRRS
ncbi:cysteine--tRNA ligase [Nisaea acidiphila]|uniref:Cysteine--tRNA ligase n=1 Tax=Nisaea acidiphila TaxID=1862145 RepID=A0A9J7AQG2_9PROT|nr:cysteine--tRNA ligase [Nisaea acidiphila]UUX49640.1 cysteine--tRNA ligase [Nisaea acidiphila]